MHKYNDNHFFADEGHLLDLWVTSQVKYILANSIACVSNKLVVFSNDFAPVHPHMVF